jgi:hypothetical protein
MVASQSVKVTAGKRQSCYAAPCFDAILGGAGTLVFRYSDDGNYLPCVGAQCGEQAGFSAAFHGKWAASAMAAIWLH